MQRKLTILLFLLICSTVGGHAQTSSRDQLLIDIGIAAENFQHQIRVPISEKVFDDEGHPIEGEYHVAVIQRTHCDDCPRTAAVGLFSWARLEPDGSIEFFLSLILNGRKNVWEQRFILKKHQDSVSANIDGVSLKAYRGSPSTAGIGDHEYKYEFERNELIAIKFRLADEQEELTRDIRLATIYGNPRFHDRGIGLTGGGVGSDSSPAKYFFYFKPHGSKEIRIDYQYFLDRTDAAGKRCEMKGFLIVSRTETSRVELPCGGFLEAEFGYVPGAESK